MAGTINHPVATHLLQPGTLVDDRYEVIRLVAQGGMASVYQVKHVGLHSLHALKVLNPDLAQDSETLRRFLNEGRIQARLRHPNIVPVTELVTSPAAGLIMDYVEGPTLGDLIRLASGRGLEAQVILDIFLPVLSAVGDAHKHDFVHRDLKPDNILAIKNTRGRYQPRLTDFGIAKVLKQGAYMAAMATAHGARMGTLLYMSPEQIREVARVDARADIFSLGAILYEAVTGVAAFDAASDLETMKRIMAGAVDTPRLASAELGPQLSGCIRKALAVDPAERFQDCDSFRAALKESLAPKERAKAGATHRRTAQVERAEPSQGNIGGRIQALAYLQAFMGLVLIVYAALSGTAARMADATEHTPESIIRVYSLVVICTHLAPSFIIAFLADKLRGPRE